MVRRVMHRDLQRRVANQQGRIVLLQHLLQGRRMRRELATSPEELREQDLGQCDRGAGRRIGCHRANIFDSFFGDQQN